MHSKLVKSAEFDAEFEPVEKFAQKLMRKKLSKKSDRKIEFLTVITLCKGFPPLTFYVNFFALFSADSNAALNFGFCDTHINFVKNV